MRRQTAHFWANLSVLSISSLALAGASSVVPISSSHEYASSVLTATEPVGTPLPFIGDAPVPYIADPVPPQPVEDRQTTVRTNVGHIVQAGLWYAAVTANLTRDAEQARKAAAAQVVVAAKPKPVAQVHSSAPPARSSSYMPGSGVERWRSMVAVYTDWNVDLMLRIMGCESGGDPNNKNRSSSASGLFQILGGPFDPAANIAVAHSMWATRGTQPWTASASCW